MKCPYCGNERSEVIDSRSTVMDSTRRRRKCLKCGNRFSTYEMTLEKIIENNNLIRDSLKANLLRDADIIFERPITEIERYKKGKRRE